MKISLNANHVKICPNFACLLPRESMTLEVRADLNTVPTLGTIRSLTSIAGEKRNGHHSERRPEEYVIV